MGTNDLEWAELALKQMDSDKSMSAERIVHSYEDLSTLCAVLRDQGRRIVLTSGSFDILHEGHSRYLEAAREHGDFLIVGVDSDAKIKHRKGPSRPAVPEDERLRMVTHQRGVGAVFLKGVDEKKWELVKTIHPDVLIATEETYSQESINELEANYCRKVVVLPRMATISTSARLRNMQLSFLRGSSQDIADTLVEHVQDELDLVVRKAVQNAVDALTKR